MTGSSEARARRDIVEVCRRVYAHGWLAATDGNVSVRLDDDRIVATPTGVHKGFIHVRDLIVVDRKGQQLQGTRAPSSELAMHLAVYDERSDVGAAVHAHPTNCVAFSLAGISLAQCLLPEIVVTFGSIPTVAYTTPGTEEVPEEVRKWVRDFDAMILDRHGSLTVGSDVFDAYNKLERMEHVAEITFRARALGQIRPLSCEQIQHLQRVGRSIGVPERPLLDSPCDYCNACEVTSPAPTSPLPSSSSPAAPGVRDRVEALVRRVESDVDRALRTGGKG